MDFTQELQSSDISIWELNEYLKIDKLEDLNENATVKVEWGAEIETREWGIKSIIAYAKKVTGSIFYYTNYQQADEEEHEIDIEKLGFAIEFNIDCNDGTIYVSNCEIDFSKKLIKIS